jgi:hypothetical protein
MSQNLFSVAQFRKYLEQSDSLGDALHFCTAEKIIEANNVEDNFDEEDYIHGECPV